MAPCDPPARPAAQAKSSLSPSMSRLPNLDLEGASRDVGTIELDIIQVDTILQWDKAHSIFILVNDISLLQGCRG